MLASGNLPIQQIICRIEERKDRKTIVDTKKIKIRIGDVFINKSICYKITNINNNDNIICKKFNLKPLYFIPCSSDVCGIFRATACSHSYTVNSDILIHKSILFNTNNYYDDGEFIIQAIQHLY